MVGLQWPREGVQDPWDSRVQPSEWFKTLATVVMAVVIGLLALGALPWPRRWRGGAKPEPDEDVVRGSAWRCAALLGVWIVGPVYGFYTRSFPAFDAPWEWLTSWWVWGGIVLVLGVAVVIGAGFKRRDIWSVVGRGMLAGGVVLLCLSLVYAVMSILHDRAMVKDVPGGAWQSVWMPRYLGIICPAVLVAMAALLMRLPTRPLRWSAIAIILALNLTQGWARLLVDTEPPRDRIAQDIIAGRQEGSTTRTIFNVPGSGGWTGRWHQSGHITYYLAILTGYETGDRGLNRRAIQRQYWAAADLSPQRLLNALRQYPEVDRVIVWERFGPETKQDTLQGREPYLDALGEAWRLESAERFGLRQFWNWRWLGWMRRQVYVRDTEVDQDE